jgi:ketosteroid isomerase-like protein
MKITILLLAFTIVSCNTEKVADKILIKQVLNEQAVAWNSGNLEEYMAGYFQSDSLRFASGGNVSYGWQTTLDRYQQGYPDKATMGKLIFSNIDIDMISQEAAIVFGKWELERESAHPWGLFTLIFKKTNEGWRIVHDHTSSDRS